MAASIICPVYEHGASWVTAVPWIVAVLGWGATHIFSEARERRKEIRGQIDKFHDWLGKLAQDAVSFHCASVHDNLSARELVCRISVMERHLSRIQRISQSDLSPYITGVRRAITLENFDSSGFNPQSADSEILEGIDAAVSGLGDELERQYVKEYPATFPYMRLRCM